MSAVPRSAITLRSRGESAAQLSHIVSLVFSRALAVYATTASRTAVTVAVRFFKIHELVIRRKQEANGEPSAPGESLFENEISGVCNPRGGNKDANGAAGYTVTGINESLHQEKGR